VIDFTTQNRKEKNMSNATLSKIGFTGRTATKPRTVNRNIFTWPAVTQAHPAQVKTAGGGYVFQISDWQRLERFLILGSEGGTFYASETKLTLENARTVENLIAQDGKRVVQTAVNISQDGRAAKNDYALFVLAMAAGLGSTEVKSYALSQLPKVARIGTHLFQFVNFVQNFRGWGRGLKTGIANWYLDQPIDKVAYQVTKYRNREGFTHRDLLRLSHPVGKDVRQESLFGYIAHPSIESAQQFATITGLDVPFVLESISKYSHLYTNEAMVDLIRTNHLEREHLPTEWLKNESVWRALLPNLKLTALIRNLPVLTNLKILTECSDETLAIIADLTNPDYLKKSRIHPLQLFVALKTYASGHSVRGSNSWTPVQRIVTALDDAFYLSFGNVVPNGNPMVVGLDVSGSMHYDSISSLPGTTVAEVALAMAMVQVNTEPFCRILAFSDYSRKAIDITDKVKGQRLTQAQQVISMLPSGGTALAAPITECIRKGYAADSIIIYTDNELNSGRHPYTEMQKYRNQENQNAKLVVCGITSTSSSITDPNELRNLDVCGFDGNLPNIINSFLSLKE
jgi:60 kDa SS-A/Ro ribonucleoprotein